MGQDVSTSSHWLLKQKQRPSGLFITELESSKYPGTVTGCVLVCRAVPHQKDIRKGLGVLTIGFMYVHLSERTLIQEKKHKLKDVLCMYIPTKYLSRYL